MLRKWRSRWIVQNDIGCVSGERTLQMCGGHVHTSPLPQSKPGLECAISASEIVGHRALRSLPTNWHATRIGYAMARILHTEEKLGQGEQRQCLRASQVK